jgi:hypothetical protein
VSDINGLHVGNSGTIDPAKSTLVTPNGTLAITEVGTVETASAASDGSSEAKVMRPADGYELRVVAYSFTSGPPKIDSVDGLGSTGWGQGTTPPDPTLTVIVGGVRTNIPLPHSTASGPSSAGLILSVKKGEEASLAVGVAGREHSVSIISGQVADNTVSQIYGLANRQVAVNKSIATFKHHYGGDGLFDGKDFTYDLSVDYATLTPYDAANGWAPDGQVWLEIHAKESANTSGGNYDYNGWVVTANGKRCTPGVNTLLGSADGVVGYLIPASTRSVTAHLQGHIPVKYGFGTTVVEISVPTALDISASFR